MDNLLVGLGFDPLVVSLVLGPVITSLLAALDVPHWSANRRRWTAIGASALLAVVVWVVGAYPWAWEYVVTVWGVILASVQTSFSILKRIGFIDWVGQVTPGGETRTVEDKD